MCDYDVIAEVWLVWLDANAEGEVGRAQSEQPSDQRNDAYQSKPVQGALSQEKHTQNDKFYNDANDALN